MPRRHFRRAVTHCELFLTLKEVRSASETFFIRYNHGPDKNLLLRGAIPKLASEWYLGFLR
jgi:hypothetical protein